MPQDDGRKLVIVPAYNEEGWIGKVLEGLSPLSVRPDYEVVVVDDGSTDKTAAIARKMGYQVISHPSNLGKTRAVLTGMRHAREGGFTFAATVDADVTNPSPELVEALIEPLKKVAADGRPEKLMTVAHVTEESPSSNAPDADLTYSGMRGFRVSGFEPYFTGSNKWLQYLQTRWPEPAFRRLFTESQTLHLPNVVFHCRDAFRGQESPENDDYALEQTKAAAYVSDLGKMRALAAKRLREQRKEGDADLEHTRKIMDAAVNTLQNLHQAPTNEVIQAGRRQKNKGY